MGKSIHCWSHPGISSSKFWLHSLIPQRSLGSSAQFPQSFLPLHTRSIGMHILPSPPQSNSLSGSHPISGSPKKKFKHKTEGFYSRKCIYGNYIKFWKVATAAVSKSQLTFLELSNFHFRGNWWDTTRKPVLQAQIATNSCWVSTN